MPYTNFQIQKLKKEQKSILILLLVMCRCEYLHIYLWVKYLKCSHLHTVCKYVHTLLENHLIENKFTLPFQFFIKSQNRYPPACRGQNQKVGLIQATKCAQGNITLCRYVIFCFCSNNKFIVIYTCIWMDS